jgi:predicted phosphodiesterase
MSLKDKELKKIAEPLRQQTLDINNRIIIVGDIHGCYDELLELMEKVDYNETDVLISVGDIVAKGPKTSEVIDYFMHENRYCVMGNHEWTVLRFINNQNSYKLKKHSEHKKLSTNLRDDQLAYLQNLPHTLHIPTYNLVIVHAGVDPNKNIHDNNSYDVMHIRNIFDGVTTELTDKGVQWTTEWNGPEFIVFGHDAKKRIQDTEHALGLDTACVYGERLSCVIYPDKQIVSVEAKKRYSYI